MDKYEKKIRDYLNSSEVDPYQKGMLADLFPELTESEDEKIMKALLSQYKGEGCLCNNGHRIPYKDIVACLERLNHTTTSAEDEDKLMLIEDAFGDYLNYVSEDINLTKHQKANKKWRVLHDYFPWIKSRLRSRWKPSEQHIRCLQAVVNDAGNAGSESCRLALSGLLRDLEAMVTESKR